jgi:hypothetical protein
VDQGRAQSARGWGGAGVLLLAWAGAGHSCAAPPVPAGEAVEEPPARYDGRYEPAFAALRAALDAHDDAQARRILERLLARNPDARTRAFAESFGRILDGRELAGDLELFLLPSSVLAAPHKVRLELAARHTRAQDVLYRGGPATLRVVLTGVDVQGSEQRVWRALALPALARLAVPAAQTAVLDLGEFEVSGSGNLALQADWELVLRAGTLSTGGEEFPANELPVRGAATVRLAPWLPGGPIPAAALADYVSGGGRALPALMERAVRVDPEEREQALDALEAPALGLPASELERLVPALRWLSGRRDLGADPALWRQWLAEREAARTRPAGRPALELPETPVRPDASLPPPGTQAATGSR